MKKFTNYIAEARKIIKRKYTDLHPAKKINTNASVRNKVISKLGEHSWQMTEVTRFLGETDENGNVNATSSWFKKNKDLFTTYTQNDASMCKLSPKGLRILKQITIND